MGMCDSSNDMAKCQLDECFGFLSQSPQSICVSMSFVVAHDPRNCPDKLEEFTGKPNASRNRTSYLTQCS